MSRSKHHTGAIKSLQFNPLKPQLLATAGAKGELYIYNIDDIENPFRLGSAAARSDDLECVAWNRKVSHILATGGSGGFVTVWDLKTKKASLTLNNSRKAVGAIAWDPTNATKLLTATPDDSTPLIFLWNLRNSNAPERTLQGHEQGILSLSWCEQDPDLLLSSGKDNRTLCWNPQTGEKLGEFPEVTNWTFQTRFNPHNPNLSATASFDGKISIQTLQNTNSSNKPAVQAPADGEDFFTKAQTEPQGSSFSLLKAPKWLERPVGASFGFGGKLVSFGLQPGAPGAQRQSKLRISEFTVDPQIGVATEAFEASLQKGDLRSICENHISKAASEEEVADWKVIETLVAENPRKGVTEYLGFSAADEDTDGVPSDEAGDKGVEETTKGDADAEVKKHRHTRNISILFADGTEGDDFLANIAATKGAKTDNPFKLYEDSDSSSDRQITKALMLGQFEKAMIVCLKEDRFADAFMIANCGGKELQDKAQAAYLSRKSGGPNYVRLIASVIGKNLWDVVYNADLANWKEIMATLCTFADPSEFPDLCEALGDRIAEQGTRKDASFCYLVGSKLEKVVDIWISELSETEEQSLKEPSGDSSFSVHARSLQNFIEKVTIFRGVTNFEDKEQSLTSGWKLNSLYEKYVEYADIVAAHGQLAAAEKYLNLLPAEYPAAAVARDRVKSASRKPAAQPAARQAAPAPRTTSRTQPVGYQPPAPIPSAAPIPQPSNPYQPSVGSTPASKYAPPNASSFIPAPPSFQTSQTPAYAPGYGAPTPNPLGYPQNGIGAPNSNFAPPPRNVPSGPPPPKSTENWNDTPMVTKVPAARRGTPSAMAAQTAFPYASAPPAPFGGPRGTATPPPPPPKGPAPPRVNSPMNNGPPQTGVPPPVNPYAPQQPAQPPQPATIPRGPSPFAHPPSAAPPRSDRYTPNPAQQQQYGQQGFSNQPLPPPSGAFRAPPPNQFAPPPGQSPYGLQNSAPPPQSQMAPPMAQGPPQGGPPGGPPRGPPAGATQTPPPQSSAPPQAAAKSRHPPGDRSHIPANAQQMVEIFTADMQRVASKAPGSFAAQVKDTQKRLNILFDHLNNEELLKPDTIEQLSELARALQAKSYDVASKMQVDIQTNKTDECGNWIVCIFLWR